MSIETLAKIDLLIYSMTILIILFVYMLKNVSRENISSRLYLNIIIVLFIIIFTETLSWITDGTQFQNLNFWLNTIAIGINTLPTVAWVLYIDYKIFDDLKASIRRLYLYLIPTYIVVIMMVYNCIKPGFIFGLSESNEYYRGPASPAIPILMYMLTVVVMFFFFKKRKMISGRIIQVILLYLLLPFLGSFIQIFIYGVSFNWPMYTLSVLLTFLLLEKNAMERDALTDLPTRNQLNQRITYNLRNKNSFTVVMIDLNHFKQINDRFGHLEGDIVLKYIATLLLSHSKPEDMVCRLGGDEFLILMESENQDLGEKTVKRLDASLHERNARQSDYRISMSYGHMFIQGQSEKMEITQILSFIDKEMYADKARRKNQTNSNI